MYDEVRDLAQSTGQAVAMRGDSRESTFAKRGFPVSETFRSIEPLADPRWEEFLQRHPRASVFHTPQWLEALRRTYGYEPVAFTSARPGEELRSGIVFSQVQSWMVRARLVSLPFSDHADSLIDDQAEMLRLAEFLRNGQASNKWRSVELRPAEFPGAPARWDGFADEKTFLLHRLDLRPTITELFRGLQKDSIQRKIRRAEREGLRCQEGRSEEMLRAFYKLTVITRRRQGLPPPPLAWYRNVLECLGESALLRLVFKGDKAIAAVLTLHYKQTMVYKYGCSDARFHSLGGMPFAIWKTIQDAKALGATELDFGRSESSNQGLITFKERFGAVRSTLTYQRYPCARPWISGGTWVERTAKQIFAKLPSPLQILAGRVIYPHIG